MTSKGKVILIDGNSLLYRAFFAMPHFSTLENQPTNAVYGFTMMLLRLIETEKPDVLIVAFDAPVKTFRHTEYEAYKAHRKRPPDDLISQAPLAREMVDAFNIPRLEIEGFEADDIVGTLAKMSESEGYEVIIVTGDLDELQLVDSKVKVMTPVKGVTETVVYDEEAVEERYGLKPDQLPDYKGLKGDTSDNIPGVPGIGDKTAVKLIKEFGSLENLLQHVDEVKEQRIKSLLQEFSEQAELSKRLGTIITDVPLDIDLAKCKFGKPDYAHLREIFKRLEFRTLLKRLPEEKVQKSLFDETVHTVKTSAPVSSVIRNESELKTVISEIRKSGSMAIRINGSTGHGVDAEPLGVAISADFGKGYYIPFDTLKLSDLRELLESTEITKYGHNLKYEYEITKRFGIDMIGPACDILMAAYLLNASRDAQSLEEIALDYAKIELPVLNPKTGEVSRGSLEEYFSTQVEAIGRLVPVLSKKLKDDGLDRMMNDVEMPLVPILADMELAGVAVDTEWLGQLSKVLEERIASLEKEIFELAGTDFNIGSPKQLQMILFEKLGLPPSKKTKTGYSTDADTLAALAPAHEIVSKILEYRELTKLKSTYADSLPKLINPVTGRIHTSLNQAITATGRLSSSEPNLQNIPIKTEIGRQIRKAFVASPGNLLISADYSQIELRILAHVSRDEELIQAFSIDSDIHTRTAAKLFEVSEDQVTPEMRRQAKTVNFAVIYGMSEYGLARELNIPTQVARHYIEEYFQEYPGVKAYSRDTLSKARDLGYVQSLHGRRRYMPELHSANRTFREFAERAAVNMPIQGTAADIVKIAMIHVYDELKSRGYKTRLVLQVHDELVFDSPEDEVQKVVPIIRDEMENAFRLDVPIRVDLKAGKDWCSGSLL